MRSVNPEKPISFRSAIMVIFFGGLLMTQPIRADSIERLSAEIPKQINGWTAQTADRIFDEQTIFGYIDGAAEVYRAYNMRQCLSRRYATADGPAIVLDIFDMGSSEDAFGVFTHDTDGQVLDMGQDARLRPGWLSFWKDRYFVSIYMEEETEAAETAVKELGRQVAAKITREGSRPPILSRLPHAGRQSRSIRYLHHPIVLNYHYYLSDENILNISSQTQVVLANYRHGNEAARLLLVVYSDIKTATKSHANFLEHYLPDADSAGTALLENGQWAAARLKGRILAIVLEADSRQLAENLLKSVEY